jgi:hypothetical protein
MTRANVLGYFFSYGIILQVLAVVHWLRRRPDTFWLWIILIGGGLGALVYFVAEGLPDLALLGPTFRIFPRRKRMKQLRTMILDNPAPGNYEELGDLLLEEKKWTEAKESFDKAITSRTLDPHPYYGRALAEMELGDFPAAVSDLEQVLKTDRGYDYHRAVGLYGHALGHTGRVQQAAAAFSEAIRMSTLSETQYNYALFLQAQGRSQEAREMAQLVLAKKATLPRYLKRRERPWFRKASALLREIPKPAA